MLTREQVTASAAGTPGLFIEAHPGSGKTTVAAERYGFLRYASGAAFDSRAVVAMSFTRAATRELRQRVSATWGRNALAWPNRVVTIDVLLRDLVQWLLSEGHIQWVDGRTELIVYDSWRAAGATTSGFAEMFVHLHGRNLAISTRRLGKRKTVAAASTFREAIASGVCTHDEVRDTMADALSDPALASLIQARLLATLRALIVDEAFDANELDIALIETCLSAGVPTTMIGDPWQALYEFRGARPDEVRRLTERADVVCMPLTASFRWKSEIQRTLTSALRNREAVTLRQTNDESVDVVLAREWKPLWEADDRILPLAFGSARADLPYAAATLVLSQLTLARFGVPGVFVRDARATLGLSRAEDAAHAQDWADQTLFRLASEAEYDQQAAYSEMCEVMGEMLDSEFPPPHWKRQIYFKWLKSRLLSDAPLVPGLTVHQAKGREWDKVGLVLADSELSSLGVGLDPDRASNRRLYVACTRARHESLCVAVG